MDQTPPAEQSPPRSIVVSRLDGLGDAVLGTTLLAGLHDQWPGAQIKLLVRPRLLGIQQIMPDWVRVLPLDFDSYAPIAGNDSKIADSLRTIAPSLEADLFILAEFNRAWAAELLAMLSKSRRVVAFANKTGLNASNRDIRESLDLPMPSQWELVSCEYELPEPAKYRAMLAWLGIEGSAFVPTIRVQVDDRNAAAAWWLKAGLSSEEKPIVLFPGSGDGLLRSLPAPAWVQWTRHLLQNHRVALLGSENDVLTIDALHAAGMPAEVAHVHLPVNRPGLLAGILELAGAYIGADTGPMHIAAALNRPTLGVFGGGTLGTSDGGHDPRRFLPIGRRAAAIRMPLGCYGCNWDCAFGERLCLTRMPIDAVIQAGDTFLSEFLDGRENPDPLQPRLFDLKAHSDLPLPFLKPMMRQHQHFLRLNHDMTEHHDHLERILRDMTRQNVARDNAIAHINNVLAEMTRQNNARDNAIATLAARR